MTSFSDNNIRILLITRIIRNFYFGYLSFILPLYLKFIGFSYIVIGLYALVATISSSILVLLSGFSGDLYSRRKMLMIMSSLTIFLFMILLITRNPTIIFVTSVLGISFSAMGGGAGGGPIAPLINAMVADRIDKGRTTVYSIMTASGTFSGVAGGVFSYFVISRIYGYYHVLFITGFILAIISVALTFFIEESQTHIKNEESRNILPKKSGKKIIMISIAGAMGSLGLGIILPLMSLYFKAKGLNTSSISLIFTGSYILAGIAVIMSPYFERIFGTIKGIVIFRALGSVLLVFIPFVPVLAGAAIYIIRTAFYQMALPIRQNFSMNVFTSDERSRGSSITGIFRRLPYGVATSIGGALFAVGFFALAFISAGLLSLLDPFLYYLFFKEYSVKSTATP
ncbi:MAG: MFS transporter [Thermoplasmata archaeon]